MSPNGVPVIYLVRHGETEWNVIRRFQGRSDSPLTALGLSQAATYAGILRGVGAAEGFDLVSSPLGRAAKTAEIIGAALGLKLCLDPRLEEISLGSWDGCTFDDIRIEIGSELDGAARFDWYFSSPDGEGYDAARKRLQSWLADQDRPVIAVTHGLASRILRGIYLGLDRASSLSQPVPQNGVYRLADGTASFLA